MFDVHFSLRRLDTEKVTTFNQDLAKIPHSTLVKPETDQLQNTFYLISVRYSLRLLETTLMLLNDMARAAMMGCSSLKNPGKAWNG